MRLLSLSWLACFAVALVACSPERDLPGPDAGGFPAGPDCKTVAPATLDEVFASSFDKSKPTGCTTSGCHGSGAGGLTFRTARELWAATVNKPSANRPDVLLVQPGDPGASDLYWRLHPSDSRRMPQGGPYLDDAALAQVAGWICAGAPEPADAPDGGDETPDAGTPGPTIDALDPSSGLVGTPVTITGTGFSPNAAEDLVAFNGVAAVVTRATSTTLSTNVPSGATTGKVTVTVAGRTATSADDFQLIQPNPLPVLVGIAPSSVVAGDSNVTLVLDGSAFVALSTAEWDGVALPTQFVSAERLTTVLPADKLAAAGEHTVTVTTPGPGGGTSQGFSLRITNPVPQISVLTPAKAIAGSGQLSLRLDGTGFVPTSVISLNGAPAQSALLSATALTVQVPASSVATAGSVSVVVTNPAPGGGASAAKVLAVENPAPVLSSVDPAASIAGSPASITLSGTGFVSSSQVKLDGASLPTTFVSATQLRADVAASNIAIGGTHELVVVTPAPGGGTSAVKTWTANNPLPAIASLSPASVATNGAAFTLTVNGSGFNSGSIVSFDGAPVATTFASATSLEAQIPTISTAGGHSVTVTNPAPGGGTSSSATLTATTTAAPTITGLDPEVAQANTAFTLTVTGSGYVCSGPIAVVVGNTSISPASCTTTRLTASVPGLATDSYPVTVQNTPTRTSNTATLRVADPNPVPTLAALSPSSATAGSASFTITATGSDFAQGAVLSFNGQQRATTVVSATQLTASITSSDVATAGSSSVTVTNPAPGGGTSGSVSFAVVAPNPVPTISALSPASVGAGSGAVDVTASGTGFVQGATATFDGSARTATFVSSTALTVALGSGDTQAAGTHSMVVTNPAPGGGASNSFSFTVVAPNPMPVLSALSPSSANAGGAPFTLTATGSGFVSTSSVIFNGVAKSTTFVSPTELRAAISSADIATAGTYQVEVRSPTPGGGTSQSVAFGVANPVPAISSLVPATATVGGNAFALTVNGTGFVTSSVVRIDGNSRTTRYVNSTQLSADVLASDLTTTGTRTVTVANPTPGGGTSGGATLTVTLPPNPVPQVSTLSPCGKVAGAGTFTLTISGANFVQGATATFGGTALAVTYVSPTQLTASVPGALIATAPTGNAAPVIVSNPGPGGGAASTVSFGVASRQATLSSNVQRIFTQNCLGCHAGPFGSQGLDLSSGASYGALVGVPSTECGDRRLVQACGALPSESYLVAKITGEDICGGGRMPQGGPPLSPADQQWIIDWVAQGAPQ